MTMHVSKNINPQVAENWRQFLNIAPEDDDVQNYIDREIAKGEIGKPFHIPLLEKVFFGVPFDKANVPALITKNDMKVRKSAPSVIWSGRTEADLSEARQRSRTKEKTRLTLESEVSSEEEVADETSQQIKKPKTYKSRKKPIIKQPSRRKVMPNRKCSLEEAVKILPDGEKIVCCARKPGPEGCSWIGKDASMSLHKFSSCSVRIMAICKPAFEDSSSSVLCRYCSSDSEHAMEVDGAVQEESKKRKRTSKALLVQSNESHASTGEREYNNSSDDEA